MEYGMRGSVMFDYVRATGTDSGSMTVQFVLTSGREIAKWYDHEMSTPFMELSSRSFDRCARQSIV
jgi:hypothetical protein